MVFVSTFTALSLCLLYLVSAATDNSTYIPAVKLLLNCGSSSQDQDFDGRIWIPDVGSKFTLTSLNTSISTPSSADPSVPAVPFMTARIFHSQSTYSFPVGPGRKFVRLHFYPAQYDHLSASYAVFAVRSSSYTLLQNFSAYLTCKSLNSSYITREYSINVPEGFLNLTFVPSPSQPHSYAFVNGIEIISMPDIFEPVKALLIELEPLQIFPIRKDTVLQTIVRLNVGGAYIGPSGDDSGLFRPWYDDSPYIWGAGYGVAYGVDPNITIKYPTLFSRWIAPIGVYSTARSMGPSAEVNKNFNLTWIVPMIDSGFTYLVRLHFCNIRAEVNLGNQVVFDVFINNHTAQPSVDLFILGTGKGQGIASYIDYVLIIPGGNSFLDLWIALHPSMGSRSRYLDATLNGLEIFKLNESNGNLAGSNPFPTSKPISHKRSQIFSKSKTPVIAGGIAGATGFVTLISLGILIFRHRRQCKVVDTGSRTGPTARYLSSLSLRSCRHFAFAEMVAATNNFDEELLIGTGGFGKVYKGEIDGGNTKVAVKRGTQLAGQGIREFQTEIELLSNLRHQHLVSLVGFCQDNSEMILVYEYVTHGTLRSHLYGTGTTPLSWIKRLEICIGVARGLHYLHTGSRTTTIHRDVKTTNILLNENHIAKVSDFGLSKIFPALDASHVSTVVKGSFGYLDPEYFHRHQLTEKSDVYSLGVVLFEVLCARPAVDSTLDEEEESLATWVLRCLRNGIFDDQMIDPSLRGKIERKCFKIFTDIAEKCLADRGINRPSMSDILRSLEIALQIQKQAEEKLSSSFKPNLLQRWKSVFMRQNAESRLETGFRRWASVPSTLQQ